MNSIKALVVAVLLVAFQGSSAMDAQLDESVADDNNYYEESVPSTDYNQDNAASNETSYAPAQSESAEDLETAPMVEYNSVEQPTAMGPQDTDVESASTFQN